MTLNAKIPGPARWEQGFLRKRWRLEPRDKALEKRLNQVEMPGIVWKHGYQGHGLEEPSRIVSDGDGRARWLIETGYVGFVTQKPALRMFVSSAADLERALGAG